MQIAKHPKAKEKENYPKYPLLRVSSARVPPPVKTLCMGAPKGGGGGGEDTKKEGAAAVVSEGR